MAEFAPEAWLLDKKIATLAPNAAGLPSLVQAITGERVTGSSWGHPQGNAIYNASQVLGDSDIALTMKLVDAKVTFVHCSLWGAILGAVLDPHWQQSARLRLKPLAAAVLTRVEREGTLLYVPSNVPFDADRKTMRAARVELERSAVLIVGEKHTDTGSQHGPHHVSAQEQHACTVGRRLGRAVQDHCRSDRQHAHQHSHQHHAAGHAKHARQHGGGEHRKEYDGLDHALARTGEIGRGC